MKIVTKKIEIHNEELILTNQRVIYWEKQKALLLSDLHIGKSAHFQRSGIPIPSNVVLKDLERLEGLIRYFNAENLIVVGDLFHAEYNKEVQGFKAWLTQFKDLTITLIKGNHDKFSDAIYQDFGLQTFDQKYHVVPFTFVHEPEEKTNDRFVISGHIHPGVFIKGKARQRIKLPCFQMNQHQLILPAFSLFTGLNTRNPISNAINYAFTDDSIFVI